MTEPKLWLSLESSAADSEKKQLSISDTSPYRLLEVKGLESTGVQLDLAKRAAMDGAEVRGCVGEARRISILFEASPEAFDEEKRRFLIGFFVPGGEGVLTVDRGLSERRISYRIAGAEFEQPTLFDPLRVRVKLVCPEPWFEDARVESVSLFDEAPLLSFPFTSYLGAGVTAGYRSRTKFLYMENEGDLPAGVRASFHVLSDGVVEPYLHFSGKRVTVKAEVKRGDLIEISTVAGNKFVRVNGQDVPFARESNFFSLPLGRSLLIVGAQSGSVHLSGEISCRFRYLGA